MRNALVKKIFTIFLFLISITAHGQDLVLPVGMRPQETNKWCWAASMEMLFRFHKDTIGQSELATDFLVINNGGKAPDSGRNPYNIEDCFCHENNCYAGTCDTLTFGSKALSKKYKSCYITLPVYQYKSERNPGPQWFDLLFSVRNYSSIEEINRDIRYAMPWTTIIEQINKCRPFILTIAKSGEANELNSHAVAAKGYYETYSAAEDASSEKEDGNLQFVLVNDPWEQCQGCERLLPYELFLADSGTVNKILDFTYNVYPKKDSLCNSCKDSVISGSSALLDAVKNNVGNFIGTKKSKYTNEEFKDLINDEENYCDSVHQRIFISSKILMETSNKSLTTKTIQVLTDSIVEVTYKSAEPPITTVLQKSGALWAVKEISLCGTPCEVPIRTSDADTSATLVSKFSIVSAYPLQNTFYLIQIGNQSYYTPAQTYANFFGPSKPMIQGILYPENQVLRALKQNVIQEYGNPRKCFLNFNWLFPKKGIPYQGKKEK